MLDNIPDKARQMVLRHPVRPATTASATSGRAASRRSVFRGPQGFARRQGVPITATAHIEASRERGRRPLRRPHDRRGRSVAVVENAPGAGGRILPAPSPRETLAPALRTVSRGWSAGWRRSTRNGCRRDDDRGHAGGTRWGSGPGDYPTGSVTGASGTRARDRAEVPPKRNPNRWVM